MNKIAFTFLVTLVVFTQTAGQPFPMNFVGLSVKDISAEQAWYCNNLGFKVKLSVNEVAPGIKFGMIEADGMMIELIEDKKAPVVARVEGAPLSHGIFKFGFRVDDLNATLKGLESKGIKAKYGPFVDQATKVRNAIIEDPEGNLIQFFEFPK